MPNKCRGEEVRLAIRIANLACLVEVHDRGRGVDATLGAARLAAPTVGPDVVKAWREIAAETLADVDALSFPPGMLPIREANASWQAPEVV